MLGSSLVTRDVDMHMYTHTDKHKHIRLPVKPTATQTTQESAPEQSFFLQVKIYMKVDLHMVGCRQFAGARRLA